MRFTLYRGALLPSEFTIFDTPNCNGGVRATLRWNEEENWVRLRLKGKNVLHPHPSLNRTPGVDYFPNPFFPEPEDIQDGRYQLWIIGQSRLTTFYYDAQTLDLLGSEYDIPGPPPPGTIPIPIPAANLVSTDFFVPDENGDLDFTQEWQYDTMLRGDRNDRAHVVSTFLPHSLCVAHPFRVDLSTTRPYATQALPASEALSFRDYLNGGLMIDLTLEPSQYFLDPPIATNIGVYSAMPSVGGQIPPGWSLDFDTVFGNVAPPIRPFPGQSACAPYFEPQHIGTFNQCQGPPPGP
ncbi:MAG: hypothetical protein R3B72_49760 [Polyangiaceae bacterium]